MKNTIIDFEQIIPNLAKEGTWIGRCMVPSSIAYKGIAGPHIVKVENIIKYVIFALRLKKFFYL